jgi:hypothetical protein
LECHRQTDQACVNIFDEAIGLHEELKWQRREILQTQLLDPEKLSKAERTNLIRLFDELGKIDFPGYRQRFKECFHGRVKLDTEILKVLGFNATKIKELLPKLYDMLYEEMMKIRRLKKD